MSIYNHTHTHIYIYTYTYTCTDILCMYIYLYISVCVYGAHIKIRHRAGKTIFKIHSTAPFSLRYRGLGWDRRIGNPLWQDQHPYQIENTIDLEATWVHPDMDLKSPPGRWQVKRYQVTGGKFLFHVSIGIAGSAGRVNVNLELVSLNFTGSLGYFGVYHALNRELACNSPANLTFFFPSYVPAVSGRCRNMRQGGIKAALAGNWLFYSGGAVDASCPKWGVRPVMAGRHGIRGQP